MAIPIIYKGDDTDFNGGAPITLNIETAFDLSGCRIELSFLGCRREFSGLSGHTATLSVVFSSAETAKMPVGTHCASLRAFDSAGRVRTLTDSVRVRVTDSVDEAAGGSIDVGIGETVEELTPADGLGAVKEVVNKLARLVGASCIAMALCGATSLNDMPGTNTIYTAAETDARILELAPVPDISGKADKTNTYTKAETDAKIVELAPAPGNYATVSNRAMSAIQEHQTLEPSTNYTDAALGEFASTGAVARAATYGTPTRWTDATGCVWEVATGWRVYTNGVVAAGWTAWNYAIDSTEEGTYWGLVLGLDIDAGGLTYSIADQTLPSGTAPHWASELTSVYNSDADYHGLTGGDAIRAVRGGTNLVGRVALTNDIPAVPAETDPTVPSWAKAPSKPTYTASEVGATDGGVVTNIVRDISRGGIWDSQLEVWWTPIMENGALRYETNAVQNAADALAAVSNVVASGGLASVDAVDAKISTNNAAFVEAVTNCPVVIASGGGGGDGFPAGDWSDYGTLGALLAAIIAAITWLKNNQIYALHTVTLTNGAGTLLDRAGNRVVVSGDTTLTLPALVNAGKLRDFLVRLEISGSTVPTITFAAPTGETITYETDGDEFPVPDEAGDWLYSFTESCVAHTFAVSLKKVSVVTQGGV